LDFVTFGPLNNKNEVFGTHKGEDLIASVHAIILPRVLFGLMAAYEAAHGSSDHPVMASTGQNGVPVRFPLPLTAGLELPGNK
jgi:hypothetical protein